MIPRVRNGRDRRPARTVIDRLRRGPAYGAVRARGVGERVLVDGEVCAYGNVSGHVCVGARIGGRPIAPVYEVVADIRCCRNRRSVGTVVCHLRCRSGERTVGASRVRERVLIDGEVRRYGDVAGNAGVGARGREDAVAP